MLPTSRRRQVPPGYTLVELLTMVAIFAVLAALTLGVLIHHHEATARLTRLRVLFVGNSYTAVHDMPELVRALARAAGEAKELEFGTTTPGSWTLAQHHAGSEFRKHLRAKRWDYVVLQEQ